MTQNGALAKNMRLLGHNDLGGFGNCGEGMAIQLARDGRRVLWQGHESAPKNFTGVDVTDPRKPSVIVQTDLPHRDMRSNNLDLVGDLLLVPYQTSPVRIKRAAGPPAAGGDSRHPTRPSPPRRPSGAWIGYSGGGAIFLATPDMARPRLRGGWASPPPYPGFTHTLLPLFDPQLMIVSDEATAEAGKDWPKLVWVVDVQDETNPVPISTFPIPAVDEFKGRGGRYGAHNLHENRPVASNLVSEKIIFGTFFNGGVRAYDVSNPFRPEEVAYYVPEPPRGSRAGAVQINDVLVDERNVVYAVDRLIGGLYTLQLEAEPRWGGGAR